MKRDIVNEVRVEGRARERKRKRDWIRVERQNECFLCGYWTVKLIRTGSARARAREIVHQKKSLLV